MPWLSHRKYDDDVFFVQVALGFSGIAVLQGTSTGVVPVDQRMVQIYEALPRNLAASRSRAVLVQWMFHTLDKYSVNCLRCQSILETPA